MTRMVFLICISLAAVFYMACGSDKGDSHESMQASLDKGENGEKGEMKESEPTEGQSSEMKSSEAWIRSQPVDVSAVDENKDGFVYQDPMDWDVIADEEGKCPKCGMFLKKVTIDEAIKNLKDNGYTVK